MQIFISAYYNNEFYFYFLLLSWGYLLFFKSLSLDLSLKISGCRFTCSSCRWEMLWFLHTIVLLIHVFIGSCIALRFWDIKDTNDYEE